MNLICKQGMSVFFVLASGGTNVSSARIWANSPGEKSLFRSCFIDNKILVTL